MPGPPFLPGARYIIKYILMLEYIRKNEYTRGNMERRQKDMEQSIFGQEYLRGGLFEEMLPRLIYEGEKTDDFSLNALENDGGNFAYSLYRELCAEEKEPCPYSPRDFTSETLKTGGIDMVQVSLPPYNPDAADIIRAYVLFVREAGAAALVRYFVTKHFHDGRTFVLYISPEHEKLLGDEITGHEDDLAYEHWKLAKAYVCVTVKKILSKVKEKEGKAGREKATQGDKEWSRDWRNFDWGNVGIKLEEALKEAPSNRVGKDGGIGITKREVMEYFEWLYENEPDYCDELFLYSKFKEKGMEDGAAEYFATLYAALGIMPGMDGGPDMALR